MRSASDNWASTQEAQITIRAVPVPCGATFPRKLEKKSNVNDPSSFFKAVPVLNFAPCRAIFMQV